MSIAVPSRSFSLVGLGVAVAGSVIIYCAWRRRSQTLQWEEVGEVADLVVFPVKAGRGHNVQTATATNYGLQTDKYMDRSFVVVMPSGGKKVHVWPSLAPPLSTIVSEIQGDQVHFSSHKSDRTVTVDVKKTLNSEMVEFYIKTHKMQGYDCGAEAGSWLQEVLYPETDPAKRPALQLAFVGNPDNFKFSAIKPDIFTFPEFQSSDVCVYHDNCAYLLTSKSSLDDLNSKLKTPVRTTHFRGNIVVSGQPPFDEDYWAYVKIGDSVTFRTLKPRETCLRITINAENGTRQSEILETLKKYRVPPMPPTLAKHWGQKPIFGIHMGLGTGGQIAVGDKVYAVRKKPHWFL